MRDSLRATPATCPSCVRDVPLGMAHCGQQWHQVLHLCSTLPIAGKGASYAFASNATASMRTQCFAESTHAWCAAVHARDCTLFVLPVILCFFSAASTGHQHEHRI